MSYPDTPCCGEAPTILRQGLDDPDPGALKGYRCESCGTTHEACGAELDAGGYCRRLPSECSYHGE